MSSPARVLAGIFLLSALYCGLDPFHHSPIHGLHGFDPIKVEMPPSSEVPADSDPLNLLQRSEIKFLYQIQGPESIAFDPLGGGPYTGVADGRVLFWDGHAWKDFAYTSHKMSKVCGPKPSPLDHLQYEHICGRPLGLRFDKKNGDLYIADAYFGLMKVGREGGLATSLTTGAEGVPFVFTNDLDIDHEGNVYFTDSSSKYQRRNFSLSYITGDNTGRLLKYSPTTMKTTVLKRNIQFPNGLSLSKDGSFFVFCEGTTARLWRYWLKGDKAGTSELFSNLPGFPDNVRTNKDGDFWVAIHSRRSSILYLYAHYPTFRKFALRLPIPKSILGGKAQGMIMKFSPEGKVLRVLEDSKGKVVRLVSEVEEKDGKLWMGSVLMPFIAVYDLRAEADNHKPEPTIHN